MIRPLSEKSTSVTFRIPNDDLETLRAQADDERLSVNTLVKKILRHHITWQRTCTAAGLMPIHRAIAGKLVDAIDEKTLGEIAIESANAYVDSLLLMQGDAGLESAIELLIREFRASGFLCKAYSLDDKQAIKENKIMIQHDMGAKWSVFLKAYVQQIIHNTGHRVQIDINPKSIVIEVDTDYSEITKTLQQQGSKDFHWPS